MIEADLQRAGLLLEQGRFELAEETARRFLASAPQQPLGHAFLSLALLGQDKFVEARVAADDAVGCGPDHPVAHDTRARVLISCNRFPEAEAAAVEAVRLDPENPGHHSVLASALASRARWQEALDATENGLALDPEEPDLLNLRTRLLVQLGRVEDVGGASEQALRAAPEDADSHASVGWAHLNQREFEPAFVHFREALRLNPESEFARSGVIEAIKARNPFYALILRYFLWVGRLGSKGFYLMIGLYLLVQVITRNLESMPEGLQWVALAFIILYVLFCVVSWTAAPLFNLALRFHKFGRLVLSKTEFRDATILAVGLLVSIGTAAVGFLMPPGKFFLLGLQGLGTSMLFAASTMHEERRRLLMTGVVAVSLVIPVHFGVTVPNAEPELAKYPFELGGYLLLGGLVLSSVLSVRPIRR